MEAQGKGFLKVCGILMIIGGGLGAILSLIAVMGAAYTVQLAAMVGLQINEPLLIAGLAISIIGSAFQLFTGIQGVKNCANVSAADKLLKFGIIIVVINIVSVILNVISGAEFNIFGLLLGLVVPVLFIIGAMKNKN